MNLGFMDNNIFFSMKTFKLHCEAILLVSHNINFLLIIKRMISLINILDLEFFAIAQCQDVQYR